MSVAAMTAVWNYELAPNEKLILLAYADHADDEGYNIFPAVARIARKTGYSEREVQYVTKALGEKGLLIEDGKGPRGTNRWRIPMRGGAIFAPVQFLQGATLAVDGGANSAAGSADLGMPVAPELNHQNKDTYKDSEDEKLLRGWMLSAADQVFPLISSKRLEFMRLMERARLSRLGNTITISGMPDEDTAGAFGDHYGKSLARALIGIMGGIMEVRFEP